MFWTIASIVLFAAALLTFLPLLRGKTLLQPLALALVFLVPVAGLLLYNQVGTPQAIDMPRVAHPAAADAASSSDIDAMVEGLRAKLTESTQDLDGWMLLARTLKTMQRYPEALDALQVAYRIAPDNPAVMVELAEARIFVSPDGRIDDDSLAMLERALELDPLQQKGLWLTGIAAAQAGDLPRAVGIWERLLAQLEPNSEVAKSLQTQIDQANSRLGQPSAPAPVATTAAEGEAAPAEAAEDGAWQGTPVRIAASEAARAQIPTGAVLFVVIRSPGPAVGPPLGVRRVIDPVLPLDITINDGDSMLQERKISLESEIQLQARISLSGSPAAASGDWQSAVVKVPLSATDTVELVLDQRVE